MKTTIAIALALTIFSCQKPIKNTKETAQRFDQTTEEKAIMAVIENETDCFFKGNYDCCYVGFEK